MKGVEQIQLILDNNTEYNQKFTTDQTILLCYIMINMNEGRKEEFLHKKDRDQLVEITAC